ncbi:MAG TPA: hypothetical protein HA223_05320 [Nanoarchaeota archaeon]|nr:hypothetical protein [Nanoarchaeota archaeon]
MQIDFEKVNKPLEKKPLWKSLAGHDALYERIRDCCVLFVSCLNYEQRKEAAAELRRYFSPDQDGIISCLYFKDTKKILLTANTADSWHYVTSIPASARAHKMLGEVYLISMN